MPLTISQPSAAPAGDGSGDVNGPAPSTNNAVVRYDGTTGKVIQNSTLIAGDDGTLLINGQYASRHSTELTEIFSMSDFPAPAGGVITLLTGKYSIRSALVTSDRFAIGAGQTVLFEFENHRSTTLTYTGTGTLFTVASATRFDMNNVNFLLTGAGAQFIDMSGGGNCVINGLTLTFTNTGASVGTLTDTNQFLLITATIYGFETGVEIHGGTAFQLTSMFMQSSGVGTGPLVRIGGGVGLAGTVSDAVMVPGVAESVVYICPCIEASMRITGLSKLGGNGFFAPATKSGVIASIAQIDASTIEITDVAHGLVNGDTISIVGTVNYDAGYVVANKTDDTFEVSATWVSTETGTWNNAGLDQDSKYVFAQNNGAEIDSKSAGEILVSGNVTPTTISLTQTFYDLNLNASAAESAAMSRFTLTDSTTGQVRYDGLNPELVEVSGLLAAVSAGGAQRFNFRLLLNGSPLPAPDNVNVPIEIGATITSAPLHWDLHLDPGDLLRLQVENADGTSDVTIDTLKFSVRS